MRFTLSLVAIVLALAVVTAIPLTANGNGTPSTATASSGFTSQAANCGQVEIDIFNLNVAGQASQDLFQYITFNGGQGVNFAATTPYTLTLPQIITNGGVELEIILSSLQGSFSSPGGTSGPFNASIDTIAVTLNANTSGTLTQNYSRAGNNFTFPALFLGNGSIATVNNFSITIIQVFPAQDGLPTNSSCTTQYILSVTNAANITVRGDPQFVGLRGQSYQIHGIDDAVYNLITDVNYQLNSRFKFLNGPRPCPLMPSSGKKSSACWTHAGSYLSELGLTTMSDNKQVQVFIAAGPSANGFASVTINGKSLAVGESTDVIQFNTTHELTLHFGAWTIEVENSDYFVNLRSVSVAASAWSKLASHGLLGQTWSNKRYSGQVSAIEGEVDDYLINDNSLFGSSFVYNKLASQ